MKEQHILEKANPVLDGLIAQLRNKAAVRISQADHETTLEARTNLTLLRAVSLQIRSAEMAKEVEKLNSGLERKAD